MSVDVLSKISVQRNYGVSMVASGARKQHFILLTVLENQNGPFLKLNYKNGLCRNNLCYGKIKYCLNIESLTVYILYSYTESFLAPGLSPGKGNILSTL